MSADFTVLWSEAVRKYKSETNEDLPSHLSSPSNISADTILDEVQKKQGDFISFREKREGLRGKLAPLCFTLQSWAETAGHFVKLTFPPGEGICSAVVVLLKAANGVSEKYNAIAGMMEDLNDLVSRVQFFAEDQLSDLMKQMIVENLAHVLVILGSATKAIKEGRGRAFLWKLIGKDGKVQSALRKMDKLASRESHTVAAVNLSMTNKVLARLEEGMQKNQDANDVLKNMIARIASDAEAISDVSQENRAVLEDIRSCVSGTSDSMRDQRYHEIIRWISAPNVSSNHEDACEKRTSGTGAWLMKDERYLRWKSGEDSRPLWLYGGPGCGKSVLISTAVEDIRFSQLTETSTSLTYFYFDFRDPEKQKCRSLVASIVDQLSFGNPEAESVIEGIYARLHLSKKHLTWRDLAEIFNSLRLVFAHTYIIIDALDECAQWDDLSKLLELILNIKSTSLRLLCSSRREIQIHRLLSAICIGVNIESSVVDSDISVYIDSSLRSDKRFARWKGNKADLDNIRATLESKANGMFRWAYCQLDSLSQCYKPKELREALRTLPASLNETYDRILLQISNRHSADVLYILQWLTYSETPIKLVELIEILAIDYDLNPPRFIAEDRPPDPQDIVGICRSLITLNSSGILELAHFSVKEYLTSSLSNLSDRTDLKPSKVTMLTRFSIDEDLAHTAIARSCLIYLLQFSGSIDSDTPDIFPLAHYAAKYWVRHYHQSRSHSSSLRGLILSLFHSEDNQYYNWIRFHDIDKPTGVNTRDVYRNSETIPSRLYLASLCGLTEIAKEMLMRGEDVNGQGGRYGSPLQAACFHGHKSTVHLLLANGGDVKISGGNFGSALQAAAYCGSEAVVELLLKNGADTKLGGGYYGSALHAAAWEGHEAVAKLLLENLNAADVNMGGGENGSALQSAAFQGHEALVMLLLKNGADVNSGGGPYGSALQAAAKYGHGALVNLLLKNGADVNMRSDYHGPALHHALANGHESLVDLLLKHGAEINIGGGPYGSALLAAVKYGHNTLVKLLLKKGADINMSGEDYEPALQTAASGGHVSVVELLLENGAEVNMMGGQKYGSALETAARAGHEAVAKLLLENGADVNMGGALYGSALQAAAAGGHEAVAELLLENSADVNMGGGVYGSALQAAAYRGYEAVVKLLLENGADANMRGGKYGSALEAAASSGRESVVKLLLENGADVKFSGGQCYGSALQAAAYRGHEAVAKLLLENGADVNMGGGHYGSALQAAALNGHEVVVKLLLESGADVNIGGGEYGSALQAAALGGHKAVVKLLLESGADVNIGGGEYGSALQAAVYWGREALVKLLVENGADVNMGGGRNGSALQAAAINGHEVVVKLLLESGADVNIGGGEYGSALQAAVYWGREALVKLLVENGADVNIGGGTYGSALKAATHEESWHSEAEKASKKNVVQLLLEHGAN